MRVTGNGRDVLLDVAERIGTPGFYPAMMAAALDAAPSEDAQVIHYPAAGVPRYVVDERTPPHLRRLYAEFSSYDPFLRDWRTRRAPGLRRLDEVQPLDYDEGGYVTGFYGKTGYVDELGLVFPALIRSAVGVFVQRGERYRQDDIDRLRGLFGPLRRLHAAHRRQAFLSAGCSRQDVGIAVVERSGALTLVSEGLRALAGHELAVAQAMAGCGEAGGPVSTRCGVAVVTPLGDFPFAPGGCLVAFGGSDGALLDHALDSFGQGLLSRRERQIVRLVFAGYGSGHIASELGIAEGTVKTLRKRLYYKLDVTSERELFALFLDHIRRAGG